MKHLQKIKEVTVRMWDAGNGHWKGMEVFDCGLKAKQFVEKTAKMSQKPLLFVIDDKYNELYRGDGMKV